MRHDPSFAAAITMLGLLACHAPASAQPQAAPPAGAPAPAAISPAAPVPGPWSTSTSTIGDMLDNPATRAVLQKHIPVVVNSPQIDQARAMTLVDIQAYATDDLSDAKLAEIDKDLAKIPPRGK